MSVDAVVAALAGLASRSDEADRGLAGHFASVVEMGGSRIAIGTDGVGTKILLGTRPDHFSGLAIDCAAMNANDLICVGARPVAIVDYLAIETADGAEPFAGAIADGFSEAERQGAGSVVGGEVAVLPGIVQARTDGVPGLDIAATAIGVVDGEVLDGSAARAGDVVLGIASSGVHSNGFTRLRSIVTESGLDLDAAAPFGGGTLRDVLLTPTRLYPRLMQAVAGRDVHAAANITGGGISNLARVLPTTGARIDSWPEPSPLWQWISERTSPADRFETFNMGVGFALVVGAQDVDAVVEAISGLISDRSDVPGGNAAEAWGVSVVGRIVDDVPARRISFRAAGLALDADRKSVRPA